MSEWKKVEEPVKDAETPETNPAALDAGEPIASAQTAKGADTARTAPTLDVELPEEEPAAGGPVLSPRRYTKSGNRRGRYRYAAPLGFLVLLLAAVGVVSLIVAGVNGIRKAQDDTAVKTEIFEFLEPLILNVPVEAFTDVNASKQDSLLLSALWQITTKESIRMQREKDDTCVYAQTNDGTGRIIIPIDEVKAAYTALFGPDAEPDLHTIGDEGSFSYEYKAEENCFYVPMTAADSRYQAVPDTLKKKGNLYTLRVGFVPVTNIGIDEKGKAIEPTVEMAEYFQYFTVKKTDDSYYITAVADKPG